MKLSEHFLWFKEGRNSHDGRRALAA